MVFSNSGEPNGAPLPTSGRTEFAADSLLEGTGFEPSVPGKSDEAFRTASARAGVRSVSGCSRYAS